MKPYNEGIAQFDYGRVKSAFSRRTKYEPPEQFLRNTPWHCHHGILMFRPCSRCGRNRELADAVWGKRIRQLLTQVGR